MPSSDKLEDPQDWLHVREGALTLFFANGEAGYVLHKGIIEISILARSEQAPTGKDAEEAVCLQGDY